MATHRFEGTIVDASRATSLDALRVDALDAGRRSRVPLASGVVSVSGRFTLELNDETLSRWFGVASADLFFLVSRPSASSPNRDCLATTERTLRWSGKTDQAGTIRVDTAHAIAVLPDERPLYVIEGLVVDPDGPSAGCTIEVTQFVISDGAVDEVPVPPEPNEAVIADGGGRFRFVYRMPTDGSTRSQPAPDLRITARLARGGTAELRVPRAQAFTAVTVMAAEARLERSIYDELITRIADTGSATIALHTQSEAGRLHIATRTEQDPASIERLAAASRLTAESGVSQAGDLFFALAGGDRAEVLTERQVYAAGLPGIRHKIEAEAAAGTIRRIPGIELDRQLAAIADRAVALLQTSDVGRLAIGDLLGTASELAAAKEDITRSLLTKEAGDATFWSDMRDRHGPSVEAAVRFTVAVGAITGFHKPLVAALQAMRGATPALVNPARIAALGPAAIDAAIDGLPEGQRNPPGTKLADYRKAVKVELERAYPTAWLEGSLPESASKRFLASHPDFAFERGRIAREPGFEALALADRASLLTLERLHRVAPSAEVTHKLLAEGFTSAAQIRSHGRDRFVATMTSGPLALGDDTLAARAWDNAGWQETASSAAQAMFSPALGTSIPALPPRDPDPGHVPDWTDLFGASDSCACAHCQSVLGPNAYFVDLLQFLSHQPDPKHEFTSLRERLFARRPDLQRLVLDCDTATTPLPQIDLINEILELLVAEAHPSAWPTTAIRTSAPGPDLLAGPQIKYPDLYVTAYRALAEARYPFSLPYSVWDGQVDASLEALGVRRSVLIDHLGPPAPSSQKDTWMWMATAGIGAQLHEILRSDAPRSGDHEYWGLGSAAEMPNGTWPARMFMRATGLSFAEVQELTAVNWGGGQLGITPPVGCDIDNLQVVGLTRDTMWNLHRFLRIRYALGRSTGEVAKAFVAFFVDPVTGAFAITEARLLRLYAAQGLARDWAMPFDEALAILGTMDRDSSIAPSLFRRVFISRFDAGAAPEPLRRVEAGNAPAGELPALVDTVAPLLRVSANDVKLMVVLDYARAELGDNFLVPTLDVTLASLAVLYRIARVAKALQVEVRDILALRAVAQATDVLGPSAALEHFRDFVRMVAEFKANPFTTDEILYLVRHPAVPAARLGLGAETLRSMHAAVESGIATATAVAASVTDPGGSRTKALLKELAPGDADAVVSVLAGTSGLPVVDQQALIARTLAPVLANVDEALERLTGATPVDEPAKVERFNYMVVELVRHDEARRFLLQWIARTFELEDDIATHVAEVILKTSAESAPPGTSLLTAFLPAPNSSDVGVPAAPRDTRAKLLTLLHKTALVIRRLKLGLRLLRTMYPRNPPDPTANAPALPAFDFASLPTDVPGFGASMADRVQYSQLRRLMNLSRFVDRFPGGGDALLDLIDHAVANAGNTNPITEALATHLGWNLTDLRAVSERIPLSGTSYFDERAYMRLEEIMALLRKTGASAAEAIAWTDYAAPLPTTGTDLATPDGKASGIALSASRAAQRQHDADSWSAVARPARDRLRKAQRDRLVGYLLAREAGLDAEVDLFKATYLDVLSEPAVMTSRSVAAIAAVQTFVQRGIVAEHLISPDAARDWQWMKAYRVWEAGRKVFLYPENYIEPELRADKSPLFRALEQQLRQGAVTYEAAEAAYRTYLAGLAEVANLEIVAIYEETLEANAYSGSTRSEKIVHAFGRTAPPHRYFHRMRRGGQWLAWERIPIEARSNHFVAHSHRGRLYLLWLLSEAGEKEDFVVEPEVEPAVAKSPPDTEIFCGLGYATRNDDGSWSSPAIQPRESWVRFPLKSPEELVLVARTAASCLEVLLGLQPFFIAIGVTAFVLDPRTSSFRMRYINDEYIHGRDGYKFSNQCLVPIQPPLSFRLPALAGPDLNLFRARNCKVAMTHDNKARQAIYRDDQRAFLIEAHHYFQVTPHPLANIGHSNLGAETKYSVQSFNHAFVHDFQTELANHGLQGMLDWSTQKKEKLQLASRRLAAGYGASDRNLDRPFPEENVDFDADGPYSVYNWELFFHAPLLIATRLMKEQRFEEAQKWFHFIFNPTDGSAEEGMKRYWRVKPFYQSKPFSSIFADLSSGEAHLWTDEHLRINTLFKVRQDVPSNEQLLEQIASWREDPFDPHKLARLRPDAYPKVVFIRYVKNLVAWGDQCFLRETLEGVNEATTLYLLAQELLGPRPEVVDRHLTTAGKTYAELDLDDMSNAIVTEQLSTRSPRGASESRGRPLPGVWRHLYFCLPQNEELPALWDLVEDRLFKVRNSLSLEGVARTLPLFAPPIDPRLLVRAAAAGVNVAQALADAGPSAGPYRFSTYLSKAIELAQVVASHGQALLAALEKKDGEALGNLRSAHEVALADASIETRRAQIAAALGEKASLEAARGPVQKRLDFYNKVIKVSSGEQGALDLNQDANRATQDAETWKLEASYVALFPSLTFGLNGWCGSPVSTFDVGGNFFAKVAEMVASGHEMRSRQLTYQATSQSTMASYERRWEEWQREKDALAEELKVIDAQVAAAELRLAVAQSELMVGQQQARQAQEVFDFLASKYTKHELYDWLSGRLRDLHKQAYELAFKMARRAERAFQLERADDSTFLRFDYWDSAKNGLTAGEDLLQSLRTMEATYLAQNTRDLELTKHVSLAKHAPEQLLALRETGVARLQLTEADFDRDYPTHVLRRLKTASVTLQCTTGPNEGVLARLSLFGGQTRRAGQVQTIDSSYTRTDSIFTSAGREDSGLFELTLRDDRFLPFEGVGAHVDGVGANQWQFDLTGGNELDYRSISDLVLHLRYTARSGRSPAPSDGSLVGERTLLVSLRAQFADAWVNFIENGAAGIDFQIPRAMLPVRRRERAGEVTSLSVYARWRDGQDGGMTAELPDAATLGPPAPGPGSLFRRVSTSMMARPDDAPTYRLTPGERATLAEVWVIVGYSCSLVPQG